MLGELVQTTAGKWITHPPNRRPNGHTLGPNQVLVGHVACLGHSGGGHHLALPNLRRRGAWAATQHSLHRARRAGDGAHPDLSGLRRYTRLAMGCPVVGELSTPVRKRLTAQWRHRSYVAIRACSAGPGTYVRATQPAIATVTGPLARTLKSKLP
jgi:hypothetical protein